MASHPTRLARRSGDFRSEDQLREHYRIERELADRLREACKAERRSLYKRVYEELLERVPHHPRHCQARDASWHAQRRLEVERQLGFLGRFLSLRSVFMEIGAGDCALAMRVAEITERAYAVDVSNQMNVDAVRPSNFEHVLSDGCSIPLRPGSVDVAFSNQMIEHLHPEDALEQLRNIRASLAPGGTYVLITPNRLYGPRDVSAYFDDTPTCLHLHEYSACELRALLAAEGFCNVRFYAGARGWFVRCPYWVLAAVETVLDWLPGMLRRRIADTAPMRALLGLRVAARKPSTDRR